MTESRREFLGKISGGLGLAGAGTIGLAGCSFLQGDDEPAPIDVDEAELMAILDIDTPHIADPFPGGIADSHVETHRSRAETLLDEVPSSLGEIQNEAVRNYISEEQTRAREYLGSTTDDPSNYAMLSTLTTARRHAAAAEGAYAAARAERVREDVYEEIDSVQSQLSTLQAGLERIGEMPREAVLVYAAVETRLDSRRLDGATNQSPQASEVEAVGEAGGKLEVRRADLDFVRYVVENRTGGQNFNDTFEQLAREGVADLDPRPGDLPAEYDSVDGLGKQLFDAPVSDTPRAYIAQTLVRWSGTRDEIQDEIDNGRLASAVLKLYSYEHTRRAIDSMQQRIADGAYDRPEDGELTRQTKEMAVAEIESVLAKAEHPELVQQRVDAVLGQIAAGDLDLDQTIPSHRGREGGPVSAQDVIVATAKYAVALEHARTLPETTAWFVELLP